jgi:inner membrane protein
MWHAVALVHLLFLSAFAVARPNDGLDFWIPVVFLVAGAMLLLWELSMPGFFIAVAAIPLLILGVIGFAIPGFFTEGIIWPLLIGLIVVAPTMMITLRIYRSLGPPDAAPTTTSADTLRGQEGTVTAPVDPETTRGKVRVQGVIWSAKCETGVIPEGTRVVIKQVRGVHLLVAPLQVPTESPSPSSSSSTAAEGAGRHEEAP